MKNLIPAPIFAFNVNDQHDLQGVVNALDAAGQPGILMLSAKALAYSGAAYLFGLVRAARKESRHPLLVQLDHCRDLEALRAGVDWGVDIVMVDFADQPFSENVANTRRAVEIARHAGILIEAQVGRVPDPDTDSMDEVELTSPEAAAEFVHLTGTDLLSVAVGNVHGCAREKPRIDLARIREIRDVVTVPLVLHGCDFLTNAVLREAFDCGISKVNIGPELRVGYVEALSSGLDSLPGSCDHRPVLVAARRRVAEYVARRLSLLSPQREPA